MPVLAKDLTELVAINPTRVDQVKTPANGFPVLIMKSAAAKGACGTDCGPNCDSPYHDGHRDGWGAGYDRANKDVDKKGHVDEAPDIGNAEAVLRLLAQLIQSEARELEAGQWGEICDIEMLAGAAYTLNAFRRMEQYNAEESEMRKELESAIKGRATELGVTDPLSDTASKDAETDTEPTTETTVDAPVEKSLEELVDERVEEAVAKAVTPLAERNKALEAEMAALKATPIPGSPSITAPVAKDAAKATEVAKEIAYCEKQAATVQDRELARYYADRAAMLRKAT